MTTGIQPTWTSASTMALARVDALEMIGRSLETVRDEIGLPALGLVTDEQTKITYEGPL